jgi:plasmid stabilization system protein ParE
MSVPAVYLLEAELDIWSAWRYHERTYQGLGNRLAIAIRNTVRLICESPKMHGATTMNVRAAPVRKFPYVVYDLDRGPDVLVIAIQHGRRNSKKWRKRLKQ